ncbi:MAG: THUMP domain-containing class I SAM-dependent RNA methyltransferase [Pseudobdellovibrionaceae bacterium]
MNQFFISTPLGFEERALTEVREIWPYLLGKDAKTHTLPLPEIKILQGGLEFETDVFAALQLNFFLKTANRILMRMASFKTRDLPKFYQKFKSLPWKEYLPSNHVHWEVAAQKSRLNNEKRLQESAQKALEEIFNSKALAENSEDIICGSIYIRMEEDVCTISLDTTGEHLHKRGWSILKGEAPVRETIAAFLLHEIIDEASPAEISRTTLLDPMMGSGTFLTEARTIWSGQFLRPFAFQKWKRTPKIFLSPSFMFNYENPTETVFNKFVGFDINNDMISVASQNFANVEKQLQEIHRSFFKKSNFEVFQKDALKEEYSSNGSLWIILNPPYGERLPSNIKDGLNGLAKILCQQYKPQKIGILYPEKEKIRSVPEGYQIQKELKVNNGGIRCLFTVLKTVS